MLGFGMLAPVAMAVLAGLVVLMLSSLLLGALASLPSCSWSNHAASVLDATGVL